MESDFRPHCGDRSFPRIAVPISSAHVRWPVLSAKISSLPGWSTIMRWRLTYTAKTVRLGGHRLVSLRQPLFGEHRPGLSFSHDRVMGVAR